jgi:hypothetical protein
MTACRSCGAPVLWAVTAEGKRMPVDAEPTPAGNLVVDQTAQPWTVRVVPPDDLLAGDPPRYLPHWATCPHANEHRKLR